MTPPTVRPICHHSTEVVALTGGPGDKCLSNGDSWEDSTIRVVDVLCQCGWGCLSLPEAHVPAFCPVCDYQFKPTPTEVLPDDPDLWHGGCAPEGFRARCGLPSYSDNTTTEDTGRACPDCGKAHTELCVDGGRCSYCGVSLSWPDNPIPTTEED